ncbi:Cof-type HAD-IIB family hydrolase [Cryobacterium sp. TMT2-14]|nr:Cof-type HAD-IIB family hydrolase [Cryobacterium sp. TMT2-14]
MPRPIPCPAPVTSATLFETVMVFLISGSGMLSAVWRRWPAALTVSVRRSSGPLQARRQFCRPVRRCYPVTRYTPQQLASMYTITTLRSSPMMHTSRRPPCLECLMISPRIAFVDADGTLMETGSMIAESAIDAVRAARHNGHLVYLSTGRASVEIYPAIRDIGFDGFISSGGGFAEIGDELVIERTMPEAAVARMISFYEESGYDFYLQSFDELFPSPGVHDRFADYYASGEKRKAGAGYATASVTGAVAHPALKAFADVRPFSLTGIAKSVFLAGDLRAYDRVSDALSGDFHVITGTIPHMGRGSGEVTLNGVNKGSTILRLLDRLGLDAASALGIGDSSNDIEMLQVCGVGIAMGNASDAVKAYADEVTTTVQGDGVWNAFRRHGLI